jgi:hypothetical protein
VFEQPEALHLIVAIFVTLVGEVRFRVTRWIVAQYSKTYYSSILLSNCARSVLQDLERAFVFSPSLETMPPEAFGLGLRKGRVENVHACDN